MALLMVSAAPPFDIAGGPDVAFLNLRRDRLYVAIGEPGVLQTIDTRRGRVFETITTEKGAHICGFAWGASTSSGFFPVPTRPRYLPN